MATITESALEVFLEEVIHLFTSNLNREREVDCCTVGKHSSTNLRRQGPTVSKFKHLLKSKFLQEEQKQPNSLSHIGLGPTNFSFEKQANWVKRLLLEIVEHVSGTVESIRR